jgi:uncharacterized protein HemX
LTNTVRNGKLYAVQESRKDGNAVTEAELSKFLKKTPKYISVAAKKLAATAPAVSIPFALGGLIGSMVVGHFDIEKRLKQSRVRPEDIARYLRKSIMQHEDAIKRKRDTIAQIEQEIEAEEQKIKALQATINVVKQQPKEG